MLCAVPLIFLLSEGMFMKTGFYAFLLLCGTAVSSVMFVVLLVAGYFVIRLLERSSGEE